MQAINTCKFSFSRSAKYMHTFLLISSRKQLLVTKFASLYLIAISVFENKCLFFCVSESTKNEILQDGDCVFDSACPSEDVSLPCSYQDLLEGRFHRQIDVHTAVLIHKATWWLILDLFGPWHGTSVYYWLFIVKAWVQFHASPCGFSDEPMLRIHISHYLGT